MRPSTRRVSAFDLWVAAYQEATTPLYERADEALACARAAVKHSREIRGRAAEACIYCDGSRRHAVWCIDANAPRLAAS